MYKLKNSLILGLTLVLAFVISCKDLDELNINPNGVDPANGDLNFLLPTIETGLGSTVHGLGLGEFVSEITGLEPNTTYYMRAYNR